MNNLTVNPSIKIVSSSEELNSLREKLSTNKSQVVSFDYFIHGHGVQAKTTFKVPTDVKIKFYVKEGELFDDSWMKIVRDGSEPPAINRFENFERSEYNDNEECPDYLLMFPTGLSLDFSIEEQTEIVPNMQIQPNKNNFIMPMKYDGLRKKPTQETRQLSWIVNELCKNRIGKITIHWCACREETDLTLDEWTKEQIEKGSIRKRILTNK